MEDDPFLAFLANGGHIVGKMAQLLYPDGKLISSLRSKSAIEETGELLQNEDITIFEPAIISGGMLVRIDILIKRGNHFDLIEVKSKSGDSRAHENGHLFRGKRGGIEKGWREYIEDVAFQTNVLKTAYPNASVNSYLLLPDKAKTTNIEGLLSLFKIRRDPENDRIVEVDFLGDKSLVRDDEFLTLFNVNNEIAELWDEVVVFADRLLPYVGEKLTKPPVELGYKCRDCEFSKIGEDGRCGYRECWGKLADVQPRLLDLYQVGRLRQNGERLVDQRIAERFVSFDDLPKNYFMGTMGARRAIQVEYTRLNQEWINPALREVMMDVVYPLHFIDFETFRTAVPYHRGMRPFELMAFQWSCHSVLRPGEEPIHGEWLNLKKKVPNLGFAESLRNFVGDDGTLFIWSDYETTTLKQILEQCNRHVVGGHDLRNWLQMQVNGQRPVLDLCKLTLGNYFHPKMKGFTSLKMVLPAIWKNNPELYEISWFRHYHREEDGQVLDPYATLECIEIFEEAEVVKEGTEAMTAYAEMLYGERNGDEEIKMAWEQLLLRYCELDTMAMLIVWEHWKRRLGL